MPMPGYAKKLRAKGFIVDILVMKIYLVFLLVNFSAIVLCYLVLVN